MKVHNRDSETYAFFLDGKLESLKSNSEDRQISFVEFDDW